MKLSRGFSLVEFIIVIVLISIISSLPAMILSQQYQSFFTTKTILLEANTTTIGLLNLMREIKTAINITINSPTSVSFTNQNGDNIFIQMGGNILTRAVNNGSAQLLCNNLSTLSTFGYYDQNYNNVMSSNLPVVFFTAHLVTNTAIPFEIMAGTVIQNSLFPLGGMI